MQKSHVATVSLHVPHEIATHLLPAGPSPSRDNGMSTLSSSVSLCASVMLWGSDLVGRHEITHVAGILQRLHMQHH